MEARSATAVGLARRVPAQTNLWGPGVRASRAEGFPGAHRELC